MKSRLRPNWIVIAFAALVVSAGPALARHKHRAVPRQCVNGPYAFSWFGLFDNDGPRPNGCSPPVYSNGNFVGQDPDPFIRHGLLRDPESGYPGPDTR